MIHDCTVHVQSPSELTRGSGCVGVRYYMACSCGWVARLRCSRGVADDDGTAHLQAVAQRRKSRGAVAA